ncbi:MAG TPA: hypothetical protein VIL46_09950 [Gemmataceae bacterium]
MRRLLVIAVWAWSAAPLAAAEPAGGVAFSSLAPRGWDLYRADLATGEAERLTDHPALDYNARFSPDGKHVAFVSERDGNMELYVTGADGSSPKRLTDAFALDDHPAWSPDGKQIAFVSTREPAPKPGMAWNALYVMNADGSGVRRVSEPGTACYSPAWSPKGDRIAYAAGSGRTGGSDLYVMRPDGSDVRKLADNGGWPSFSPDGETVYFHRRHDKSWGVWRVGTDGKGPERVTPPGVSAYTPCACPDGKTLVLAVQRGGTRQVERFDLEAGTFTPVTKGGKDCWNPTVSPDGRHVVYHRAADKVASPNVELWGMPPGTSLRPIRLAGSFPAFAPDGKRIALVAGGFSALDVMNLDGSGRKRLYSGSNRGVFSTAWAHEGDRIAFAVGPVFQQPTAGVNLMTVRPDGSDLRALTEDAGNNAFPAFSPDGKQIVFRSGRDGSKNLYVMNADGTGLRRLTEGKWTDTMADWSPAGDWIVFASDRDGEFDVWLIKPDGTGLRKLVGGGGRDNHPHFAPSGKWVVFTSQRAGFSAEEISLPRQPQPYGELFIVRTDGTGLLRLTHNGFEEGTPAWGPVAPARSSAEGQGGREEY